MISDVAHTESQHLHEIGHASDPSKIPGHWLLARLGKRVLRPGGLDMTRRMLTRLGVGRCDHVVEFAPGLGVTAQLILKHHPASYVAIERDEAAVSHLRRWLGSDNPTCRVVRGCAQETGLPGESATVVYGEAMLTMQVESRKRSIVREALRLLRSSGRYGIHEMCLTPDSLTDDQADRIRKSVTQAIRHQAVPLTAAEWCRLLSSEGFDVIYTSTAPMALLEPARVIRDEGVAGALRILWRLLRDPVARQRVCDMRRVFRAHSSHLSAICIVARKP